MLMLGLFLKLVTLHWKSYPEWSPVICGNLNLPHICIALRSVLVMAPPFHCWRFCVKLPLPAAELCIFHRNCTATSMRAGHVEFVKFVYPPPPLFLRQSLICSLSLSYKLRHIVGSTSSTVQAWAKGTDRFHFHTFAFRSALHSSPSCLGCHLWTLVQQKQQTVALGEGGLPPWTLECKSGV